MTVSRSLHVVEELLFNPDVTESFRETVNLPVEDCVCVCVCVCVVGVVLARGQAAGCYPGIYHHVLLSDQFIVDSARI